MRINYITNLNIKKFKKYTTQALFLIIPITVLVALSLLISSGTQNIQTATNQSIFGTIERQLQLIEITKDNGFGTSGSGGMVRLGGGDQSFNYNQSDLDTISALNGVSAADITQTLPISQVQTTDLFADSTVQINNLTSLKSDFAPLFTDQDFTYTEGSIIPIVINANTLTKTYEDWNGQDSVSITINRQTFHPGTNVTPGANPIENQSPIKTTAITYDKNSLIGKEFTITFGGLTPIQDYTQSFNESGIVFTKLTSDEIETAEQTRKDTISPYWNYDQISTPLTYTFKVVGIIEGATDRASYIPQEFADKLMNDYIQNQLNARTSKSLTIDLLENTFQGISYDGVEISSTNGMIGRSFSGGAMIFRSGGQNESTSNSYYIPGLVIQTDRNQSGGNPFGPQASATGVSSDVNIFAESAKTGTRIMIKTRNASDRLTVTNELNEAGYAYQDSQQLGILNNIRNNLNIVTIIFTSAFIAFTIMIVVFTMGKFVSEGRKEIGIMRAIGATKSDIRNIFVSQSLLYVFISYAFGTIIGLLLLLVLAHPIANWYDSVVGQSLRDSFTVVNSVNLSVFSTINFVAFGIYSIILILIAFFISIIPATKAASISPVDAIKGE